MNEHSHNSLKIISKEETLMNSLKKFYSSDNNFDMLCKFLPARRLLLDKPIEKADALRNNASFTGRHYEYSASENDPHLKVKGYEQPLIETINNLLQHSQGVDINTKPLVSLRLIDWAVTNYAKKNNTSYILDGKLFFIFLEYKNQLRGQSKEYSDPFKRAKDSKRGKDRSIVFSHNGIKIETTIAQLNFFRWAIKKKVLDFIVSNENEIENDMKERNKKQKGKKRQQLSISATRTVNKTHIINTVTFSH